MKTFLLAIAIYLAAASMSGEVLVDTPLWRKFDEFSEISRKSQQQRLKNLKILLRAVPNQVAVIVAYGGEMSCREEAKSRAAQVRHLLIKSGIDAHRLRVVDAGYQRRWTVALYVGPSDAPPIDSKYVNSYDGHIDPTQVKMFPSCKDLK